MQQSPHGLPRPGDVLGGRFRVERILGAGGMGTVFAAEDIRSRHHVAVKLMLPQLAWRDEFANRFEREARAASSLASDHVARVFEIGLLPDGSPFMVMELLQGCDLDCLLKARGRLPIPEAVGYLLEVCHAVAEAHARGIVHRDLKPSNLFLAERAGARPIVKVLDFGISKETKPDEHSGEQDAQMALTNTQSTLGSPHYMSPEQIRSAKNVDARTDIWSLGIILYKLLTGSLPFESNSLGAHLAMIVADPPTPLRSRRSDAPVEVENLILRCLQKDAGLRFQNIGQLALALGPFAPPAQRDAVDRVVAIVGRDASNEPLPPIRRRLAPPVTPDPAPPAPPYPPAQPVQDDSGPPMEEDLTILQLRALAEPASLREADTTLPMPPRDPEVPRPPARRRGALAAILVASALGSLVLAGGLYYALHRGASARGLPAAGTGIAGASASSPSAMATAPSAEADSPPSAAPVAAIAGASAMATAPSAEAGSPPSAAPAAASETVKSPPLAGSTQAPAAGVVPGRLRPSPKATATASIYSPD